MAKQLPKHGETSMSRALLLAWISQHILVDAWFAAGPQNKSQACPLNDGAACWPGLEPIAGELQQPWLATGLVVAPPAKATLHSVSFSQLK